MQNVTSGGFAVELKTVETGYQDLSSVSTLPSAPTDEKAGGENLKSTATTKAWKTRAGSPNYENADINALLDIVEDAMPLRSNLW
eukprot:IDg17576t1